MSYSYCSEDMLENMNRDKNNTGKVGKGENLRQSHRAAQGTASILKPQAHFKLHFLPHKPLYVLITSN